MKMREMSRCRFPCHPGQMDGVVVVGDGGVVVGAGQVWGLQKKLNNKAQNTG
jgi:hypothetical protein